VGAFCYPLRVSHIAACLGWVPTHAAA